LIRAFTGPDGLTDFQTRWAAMRMLAVQPIADTWRSGCAYGIDTIAARLGEAIDVEFLELYLPMAHHNGTLVYDLARKSKVVQCPKRATTAAAYRARNERMVKGADQLVAFVWKDEFYRSGEWMTINIAAKQDIEIVKFVIPKGRTEG
jgi:hypothetical protein